MAEEFNCPLCSCIIKQDDMAEVVTIGNKTACTINSASSESGCDIRDLPGQYVHKTCRTNRINRKSIGHIISNQKEDNAVKRRLRSDIFLTKEHCIFCGYLCGTHVGHLKVGR